MKTNALFWFCFFTASHGKTGRGAAEIWRTGKNRLLLTREKQPATLQWLCTDALHLSMFCFLNLLLLVIWCNEIMLYYNTVMGDEDG